MKRYRYIATALVALSAIVDPSVSARGAEQDPVPVPVDRIFYRYDYFEQAAPTPNALQGTAFALEDSTGALAAGNLVCFLDLRTGGTRSPFAVFSGMQQSPMSLVTGRWNERRIAIVAPAQAAAVNPRVVAFEPNQILGETLRLPGADQAGIFSVIGDYFGDERLDVVFTTGPGPVTRITYGTLGDANWTSFLPNGPSYTGGAILAGGPLRGNGRHQLVVSMDDGLVDMFQLGDQVERIGTGRPFEGLDITAGIDVFDVDNNGRRELIVADTRDVKAIDLNNGATPTVLWQFQPYPDTIDVSGLRIDTGVTDNKLTIGAVNGNEISVWVTEPDGRTFVRRFEVAPFGTGVRDIAFSAFEPMPLASVPRARK